MGKHTGCLIRASAKILGSYIKSLHSGICRHIRSDRVKGNWEGRMKQCATWCWSAHFPEFTSSMETDNVSRSSSVTLILQPKGNYCQHPETKKGKKSRKGLAEALKADSTVKTGSKHGKLRQRVWKPGKPGCGSLCKFSTKGPGFTWMSLTDNPTQVMMALYWNHSFKALFKGKIVISSAFSCDRKEMTHILFLMP